MIVKWRDIKIGEEIQAGDRCLGSDHKWFVMDKEHLSFESIVTECTYPIQRMVKPDLEESVRKLSSVISVKAQEVEDEFGEPVMAVLMHDVYDLMNKIDDELERL